MGVTQSAQKSQINLVHDPGRVTKDNATYSNAYERYWVTPIENGVRVDYHFVERGAANVFSPPGGGGGPFGGLFPNPRGGGGPTPPPFFFLF